MTGRIRVVVDEDVCDGYGVCEGLAPRYFKVGDDDVVRILEQPTGEVPEVIEAVDRCPKQALSLLD